MDLTALPQKIMEICYIDLSDEERELYERMEGEAKSVVQDYITANRVTSNYTTVLSIILRLRQICTDVALCPTDLFASLSPSNIEGISRCCLLSSHLFAYIDYIVGRAVNLYIFFFLASMLLELVVRYILLLVVDVAINLLFIFSVSPFLF